MSSPSFSTSPSPSQSSSSSYDSSFLVIGALLAFVFALTIAIHLVIRLLTRLSASSTSSSALLHLNSTGFSHSSIISHPQSKSVIDSLPLFTVSSLPSSPSVHCTICLSHFSPTDKLCLLPACLHAFHSQCIDAWLKTSPSCPLCRSLVECHCNAPETPQPQPQPQPQQQNDVEAAPVAEESGRGSWLKEYVDRLAVSASSSFNSMRFSNWGSSRRFDGEASGSLELGGSFRSEESGYFASSFKWIMQAAAASEESDSLQ